MRYFLIFLFVIISRLSFGQDFVYPFIQASAMSFEDFIPRGWVVLDSTSGDLNKDGKADLALVIQLKDSMVRVNEFGDTVLTNPRILMVLFRDKLREGYTLGEQSNTFIMQHEDRIMDDPYRDIVIDKGLLELSFRLFYSMGSWYITVATYKFRYQANEFALIGAEYLSFHRATHDFEEYSYNFLTKKKIVSKGSDMKGTRKTIKESFVLPELKTLKTFARPFTWEIDDSLVL
ncbi:MAG: hypothetical protein WBP58_07385 [Chitinophagaceae bacterium]